MRARLEKLWQERAPQERRVIAVVAAVVALLLYVWLLSSAGSARTRLGASVSVLAAQAHRLDRDADELQRLRAQPQTPAAQGDLRKLVEAQAGAAGLSHALQKIDAADANQVKVVFGAVAFANWLGFIAALEAQHVRLDACRLEALSTPGLVSVTATLMRVRPK